MSLLVDLIGAVGFQINDTWSTYLGIKLGAMEGNGLFRFLSNGRPRDFIFVGFLKVLLAVFLYLGALFNSAYVIYLLFDFYLEAGVTMWNTYIIYDHKVRGG
jgi:hypothetical protein